MSPEATKRVAEGWDDPPERLELAEDTVDVWRLRLDRPPEVVAHMRDALTDDEKTRADRFRVERAHTNYVLTRAVLRQLLATYLAAMGRAVDAEAIDIGIGAHGKPKLHAPCERLHFNVSHCRDWSLLAFSRGLEVGVDVERVRPDISKLERVPRWFAACEREALDAHEGAARAGAFFRCWTRKEAFIKATGRGFSTALDSFAVSLDPESARLELLEGGDPGQWKLFSVEPADDYIGAVCARAEGAIYLRTMTATVSNSPSVQLDL